MSVAAPHRIHTVPVLDRPAAQPFNHTADRFRVERDAAAVKGEAADQPTLLEWSQRLPTAKGWRLDFNRFPFQPEVYRVFGDFDVKDADLMKSVQVGASEMLTRTTMYVADVHGLTAMHVFPAQKQMFDFSDTRVNPLRENSTYLQSRTKLTSEWPWNKGLKRVGRGYCYYRGSESKNELIGVDADLVGLDEYDDLAPQNIPEAERRVSGSLYGLIRRVGIPSDPEYGIARRYEMSDKRSWFVHCGHCGEWQSPDFFDNVDAEGERLVCCRCRKWLNIAEGEWVAEYPERDRPGFHVHRLLVPGDDALSRRRIREIVEASKKKEPLNIAAFWRNDLGLPYADAVGGLDRSALAAAVSAAESYFGEPLLQVPFYRGANLVTAGIDVASTRALNVRISEHLDPLTLTGHRKRALFIGEVEDFNVLARMLDHYGVHFACIDHLPDGRLAYALANRYPGRVYVMHYAELKSEAMQLDTELRKVSAHRVAALDATIEIIRTQRNLLPEDWPESYADHMVANRRKVKTDEKGRQVVYYDNGSQPDDYFQAEVYDVIATEVARIRMEVEASGAGELTTLDDELEFERSNVADYENMEYRPGPGGGYQPGPGWTAEDDW